MRNISIRTLAFQHIGVILVSVLAITFFGFFLLFGQLYEKQQQEYKNKTKLIAENISQTILFYNEIAHDLARQSQVIELIKNNDTKKAQQWSADTRSLLPYSNGLALLTIDGQVIGDSKQQKIGPLCIKDLLLRSEGKLNIIPPVHHPDGKKSHFDIVTPIYQDKKVIGVLFASFSLEIIQRITARLQQDNEYLFIETEQQLKVAEVGHFNPEHKYSITNITGTNWALHSNIPDFKLKNLLTTYIPTVLVLLLIIIVVTALFVIRLGKVIVQDMLGIKQALVAVHKGDFLPGNQTKARLKETYDIVDQISELATDIYDYQQQLLALSFKDELTGLHNRRTLFKDYKNFQAMIKRGSTCTLILFDLDNFKFCNDNFGHNFGDEVLQAFARILQNHIRGYDNCARLGGDEFIVIIPDCSRQEIENRYQYIYKELLTQNKAWKEKHDTLLPVTTSAGAVVIKSADISVEQVIEYADKALYNAKNSGRGKICFYSESV